MEKEKLLRVIGNLLRIAKVDFDINDSQFYIYDADKNKQKVISIINKIGFTEPSKVSSKMLEEVSYSKKNSDIYVKLDHMFARDRLALNVEEYVG
jgi:hypothetical protein